MYHVYVIESESGRKYIGMSGDVDNRVIQHNTADSFWTKRYKKWKAVYKKGFPTYSEARKWELYLKRQKGGNGLKKALSETNELEINS